MDKIRIRQTIFVFTLLHLIIGVFVPLGNDEVYYVQYARNPSIHYYDHPLMIGWVIKIFSFNLRFHHFFFYRIFSILSSSITTYVVYKISLIYGSKKSALLSAILFSTSFYFSVIAGVFAMPDAPMMLFWSLALFLASKILFSEEQDVKQKNIMLIWFGIFTGLAMLCKFHAAYIWVGFILYVLFNRLDFFLKWQFYLAGIISICFLIPVLFWNYKNDWANFSFYTGRVGLGASVGFTYFFREILGEIVYQNPFVWLFMLYNLIKNKASGAYNKKKEFLYLMSIPLLFAFWGLSLSRETLPHWSGPAYLPIIILASTGLNIDIEQGRLMTWVKAMCLFYLFVLVAGIGLIHFYPGTLGNKNDAMKYGSGDFTLDMFGWEKSGNQISEFIKKSTFKNLPIVSSSWFPAAHIDEYIAQTNKSKLFVLGPLSETHQYHWLNKTRGGFHKADSALYITPTNYFKDPFFLYSVYFNNITLLKKFEEKRNENITRYYYLYMLSGGKPTLELVQ